MSYVKWHKKGPKEFTQSHPDNSNRNSAQQKCEAQMQIDVPKKKNRVNTAAKETVPLWKSLRLTWSEGSDQSD